MTQQEFEERTGFQTNASGFNTINEVYMAAGDTVNKDTFCKAFKKRTDESWYIMSEMADTINKQSKKLQEFKVKENNMADFIIQQSERYSSLELRDKAIEMLGEKEYLRRKIEKGYNLWEEDRELLNEILK